MAETTSNAAEVAAELKAFTTKLPDEIFADNGPVANWAVDVGRDAVPFISGDLAGSVGSHEAGAALNVIGDIVYAGWVEFGGTRGRPYVAEGRHVHPAMADRNSELAELIAKAVQQAIDAYPWAKPTGGT